jgi:hypothetical protein
VQNKSGNMEESTLLVLTVYMAFLLDNILLTVIGTILLVSA